MIGGYPNYDDSEFRSPCALDQDDEKMKDIWQSAKPLQPLVSPELVKSYEELREKLATLLI
jgi:hypothetical protein